MLAFVSMWNFLCNFNKNAPKQPKCNKKVVITTIFGINLIFEKIKIQEAK